MRTLAWFVGLAMLGGCGGSIVDPSASDDAGTIVDGASPDTTYDASAPIPRDAGTVTDAAPERDSDTASDAGVADDASTTTGDAGAPDAQAPGPVHVVQLAVDDILEQCAAMSDGTVRCRFADDRSAGVVTVPGLHDVTQIVVGSEWRHFCALEAAGTVTCWDEGEPISPVAVPGLTNVVAIAESMFAACAVRDDGTVWCWGQTDVMLPSEGSDAPVMTSLTDVTDIWPTFLGWVVRHRSGDFEAMGQGPYSPSVPSDAMPGAQAANGFHLCWRMPDATVRCVGADEDGELGDGTHTSIGTYTTTPVDPGLTDVASVAQGDWNTCALMNDGTVQCWGEDEAGGDGAGGAGDVMCSFGPCISHPEQVLGVRDATQIFLGVWGGCAVRLDQSIWCWGTLAPTFGSATAAEVQW